MKYRVIWSEFSEKQVDGIFEYYKENANIKVASKIIKELISSPDKLIKNPEIGAKEILLETKEAEFRYIIYTNYKIIYTIDKQNYQIKIYDVFDTRQNPVKIEREK
ncbi:type II toxin-antitoxin system RelE/ParE family toxin [Pseudopedobacter beijingensis]|uniref:Type II toxin-antitoxin system RelE/ParE family toxin n=1 Tax=Pseudopedobacter beijingensis TaxID=1207056 RepID=A0ABW4IFS6_9SPHI